MESTQTTTSSSSSSSTGGGVGAVKYVPPHLRNKANGGGNAGSNNQDTNKKLYQRNTSSSNYSTSSGNPRAPSAYNSTSSGDVSGDTFSAFKKKSFDRSNSNASGMSGGMGGGYSKYGSSQLVKNQLGFHGDMRPFAYLEAKLFKEQSNTGINFDKYDEIPVETSGREVPQCIEEFKSAGLTESLLANLSRANFAKPTPIQKYSIPIGLSGRDMMACAQTGSGKTGAFLFPVITALSKYGPAPIPEGMVTFSHRRNISFPNALILAPTRELAIQINDEAEKFCYVTGLAPVVIYGGTETRDQLNQLNRGCDILVATPGRLVDFIDRGSISLACIQFLILDEADRMLDMGFEPQVRRIVEQEGMPTETRQTFMFSATFPKEIQRLASDFLNDYIFITVGRIGSAARDITQKVEYVPESEKLNRLLGFLEAMQTGDLLLVFVERKHTADALDYELSRLGLPSTSIHGDRVQRDREIALRSFKTGQTPILIATAVAARGLDISNVNYVINFDMPSNVDEYVHRIGRTGRAGKTGTAISFFNEENANIANDLVQLLSENGQQVPDWLDTYTTRNRFGGGRGSRGGGRGGGRGRGGGGGNRFGSRDYRGDQGGGNSGSSGNNRGYRGGGYSSYGSAGNNKGSDAW